MKESEILLPAVSSRLLHLSLFSVSLCLVCLSLSLVYPLLDLCCISLQVPGPSRISAGVSSGTRCGRDIDPQERKRRTLNALLNKLTIDNFGVVCEKICLEAEQFQSSQDLQLLADLLFGKVPFIQHQNQAIRDRETDTETLVLIIITSIDCRERQRDRQTERQRHFLLSPATFLSRCLRSADCCWSNNNNNNTNNNNSAYLGEGERDAFL